MCVGFDVFFNGIIDNAEEAGHSALVTAVANGEVI
jgi:predicted glycosyltransferase